MHIHSFLIRMSNFLVEAERSYIFFEDFKLQCSQNVLKHNCWVCRCYFPFSTNQPEVQTNRKYNPTGSINTLYRLNLGVPLLFSIQYKPTGSTNQPEVQSNRKHKYALSIKLGCAVVIFHSVQTNRKYNPTGSINTLYRLNLGVQLLFSIQYKPTGSTNQPEVQSNRKHKHALLNWPLAWPARKKYNSK